MINIHLHLIFDAKASPVVCMHLMGLSRRFVSTESLSNIFGKSSGNKKKKIYMKLCSNVLFIGDKTLNITL